MRYTERTITRLSVIILLLAAAASPARAKTIYVFQGGDDQHPDAPLIADAAGNLYGTTAGYNFTSGTVFQLTPPATSGGDWSETVVYKFPGYTGDGYAPTAAVIFDKAGSLYGTTFYGGAYNSGTVFKLTPPSVPGGAWAESVIYSFGLQAGDGVGPNGLNFGRDGSLYGTTVYGGLFGVGTGFQLKQASNGSWTEKILYTFTGSSDGSEPMYGGGSLISDVKGNLYGETVFGGSGNGVVFELSPPTTPSEPWAETVLHQFLSSGDGLGPKGGLAFDSAGNLYGTTSGGGGSGFGTIFQLSPVADGTWSENILYSFSGGSDGAAPWSSLVLDKSGNLYGTTLAGGGYALGTLFELTPPIAPGGLWTETILHAFRATILDGVDPNAGVTFRNGVLYGTTQFGGNTGCVFPEGCGTVFAVHAQRP